MGNNIDIGTLKESEIILRDSFRCEVMKLKRLGFR